MPLVPAKPLKYAMFRVEAALLRIFTKYKFAQFLYENVLSEVTANGYVNYSQEEVEKLYMDAKGLYEKLSRGCEEFRQVRVEYNGFEHSAGARMTYRERQLNEWVRRVPPDYRGEGLRHLAEYQTSINAERELLVHRLVSSLSATLQAMEA